MSAATPADALEKLEEKAKRDWRATLYTTKLSSLSGKDTIVQMQYESTKELESEEEEEAANEPFDRSVDGANMDAWASRFEGQGVYPILKLEETQGANKQ